MRPQNHMLKSECHFLHYQRNLKVKRGDQIKAAYDFIFFIINLPSFMLLGLYTHLIHIFTEDAVRLVMRNISCRIHT